MIAKVRIAPVERWCPVNRQDLRDFPDGKKLVGMTVEILTESMKRIGDFQRFGKSEGYATWRLSERSVAELRNIVPQVKSDIRLCEHMLEMD
jgi:hypothetical protein